MDRRVRGPQAKLNPFPQRLRPRVNCHLATVNSLVKDEGALAKRLQSRRSRPTWLRTLQIGERPEGRVQPYHGIGICMRIHVNRVMTGFDSNTPSPLVGVEVPGSQFVLVDESLILEHFLSLRTGAAGELLRLRDAIVADLDSMSPALDIELPIQCVNLHGEVKTLRHDLRCSLRRESQEFVLEVPDLSLYASGGTWSEAQADLFDQIGALVDHFAPLGEEALTPSGLKLRANLMNLGLLDPSRGPD